jgi:hypothetical protein
MKRSLLLILAAILLIVANTVEARHSGGVSKASGGRAAGSAAPAGSANGAGSQDHGATAQSRAPGTPAPSSGAKNFGAHVLPPALAQGRASTSSMQLAMLHKGTHADAGGIAVAPGEAPTVLASQTSRIAVPPCPTGQAMSPAPNSCVQPASGQRPHHRFSSVACDPWCYDRGLGYGMNPYELNEDCEKMKGNPEAYQKCLARKSRYSPGLPADGGRS